MPKHLVIKISKQKNECPVCGGYDFSKEEGLIVCCHCGFASKRNSGIIHNFRNFNPSSRDSIDIRPRR